MLLFVDQEYRARIRASKKALISAYNDNDTPSKIAAALVESIGKESAAEIVALMIATTWRYDGRFSPQNYDWADKILDGNAADFRAAGFYYLDEIHPAHMNQIANALRTL